MADKIFAFCARIQRVENPMQVDDPLVASLLAPGGRVIVMPASDEQLIADVREREGKPNVEVVLFRETNWRAPQLFSEEAIEREMPQIREGMRKVLKKHGFSGEALENMVYDFPYLSNNTGLVVFLVYASKASEKLSAKKRRALQQQRRERQQRILLTILAVALLIGVVGVIVLTIIYADRAASPEEAYVPPDALTRYTDFAQQKLMGTTPDGFPYLGAENAPVLFEEMSSLSCIACKQYHDAVTVNLLDEIKAGRVKYVYIPVTTAGEFKPDGITSGAFCAAQQGKFWEMVDIAFDWQIRYASGANDTARLKTVAQSLGLDTAKFSDCLTNNSVKDIIGKGDELFRNRVKPDTSGSIGTPTLFLDGEQIQPRPDGGASPNLSELRGIIEQKAAAKKQ